MVVTATEIGTVDTTADAPAPRITEAIDEVKETPMPTLRAETIVTESVKTDTPAVTDEETAGSARNVQNVWSVESVNGTVTGARPGEMRVATTMNGQTGGIETLTRIVDEEEEIDARMRSQHDKRTDAAQAPRPRSESPRRT